MARVTAVVVCAGGAPEAQGFVNRDRLLIDALRSIHEVCVLGVAARIEDVDDLVDQCVIKPGLLGRPTGIVARVGRLLALRTGRLSASERHLEAAIAQTLPDAIVVLSLWHAELVRCARGVAPTAFFAEERLGRSSATRGGGPISLSRLLRRAELASASGLPMVCVLRSDDAAWAQQRFASTVMVVPHGIDVAYWEAPGPGVDDAGPFDVVAVANLTMARTAQPLADIIDLLDARGWPEGLRLRLVSAAGYHPCLIDRAGDGVDLVGPVADPRPLYRSAMATLVPAFEANGVKNGIIQGWAIGCPVVTTPASAATVGGIDGVDLLIGEDPGAVADLLADLPASSELDGLVAAGRRHLAERFGSEAHDGAVRSVVASLLGR